MVKRDEEEKYLSGELIGKTVVSKSGKKFGVCGDIIFEVKSGELIHIVLEKPTPAADKLDLERTKEGEPLIPYSAVIAVGDFIVVSEEEII